MPIRSQDISKGHLHGIQSFANNLRGVLVGNDSLDATTSNIDSCRIS